MKIFILILFIYNYLNASFFDDYYIYNANKYLQKKEYKLSFDYYNKIENKDDNIIYNMGNILYFLGNYEEAILYYKKVKNSSLFHQVNHNIANCYIKLDDYDNAIVHYNKALFFKDDEKTKYNLNLSKLKKQELEDQFKRELSNKQMCPVREIGAILELNEETIFDYIEPKEDVKMFSAKENKNKENVISSVIDDNLQRDIYLEENFKKEDGSKNSTFKFNPYFQQKWDNNINDSSKTLIIPLEKGLINDAKDSL